MFRVTLGFGFLAGALLATSMVTAIGFSQPAWSKAPGKTYCFVGKCHRVKSLSETESLVGKTIPLVASHYSDCEKDRYNPCGLTSSGEKFHPDRPDNAASPIYPDGTVVLVRNPDTKASAVLRINNAGPYWGNRKLDVSYAAAEKLGFKGLGVAKLETKVLSAPTDAEARYVRHRNYQPTPGFIGKFESLEEAERTAVALMVLDATAASALLPSSGAARLVSMRTESRKERIERDDRRKTIEPIIKTMNLIAGLDPVDVPESVASTASIEAAPSRSVRRSIGHVSLAEAEAAGEAAQPAWSEEALSRSRSGAAASPRQRMAQAVLKEASPEMKILGERATRAAVELVQTAEVGAPTKDEWEDLLRPRLGLESIAGARVRFDGTGGFPYKPLPGRAPRPVPPYAPGSGRNGMWG
jgi:peptidoglycan lytic transglycosylase